MLKEVRCSLESIPHEAVAEEPRFVRVIGIPSGEFLHEPQDAGERGKPSNIGRMRVFPHLRTRQKLAILPTKKASQKSIEIPKIQNR